MFFTYEIDNQKFGGFVAALRKEKGYTQKELAERSGVNLRTLQEYDNRAMDINRATGGTLTALSKVLGCQVEDLLEYNYAEVTEE